MKSNNMQTKSLKAVGAFIVVVLQIQLTGLAQELPALRQEESYSKERLKLLSSGWQKVIYISTNCNDFIGFEKDTCFKYRELGACSLSGLCTFLWRNANGTRVRVTTFGYGYSVLSWSLEDE